MVGASKPHAGIPRTAAALCGVRAECSSRKTAPGEPFQATVRAFSKRNFCDLCAVRGELAVREPTARPTGSRTSSAAGRRRPGRPPAPSSRTAPCRWSFRASCPCRLRPRRT